jgi:adenylate cyclase
MAEPAHTFVFADLAGFTAMTESHGDDYAADVAEQFCAGIRSLLGSHSAEEVKTLGDEVMIHVSDAGQALRLAECAVGELGARHGALAVGIGMHSGPAVQRHRDWFGGAVNIAARVAAEAHADEVLLTAATLSAASQAADRHDVRPRGARRLKNVSDPIELYELRVSSRLAAGLVIDPVCRMAIDPRRAGASVRHHGHTHQFCSSDCAEIFRRRPDLYLQRQAMTQEP